jgi:hypothetical protein
MRNFFIFPAKRFKVLNFANEIYGCAHASKYFIIAYGRNRSDRENDSFFSLLENTDKIAEAMRLACTMSNLPKRLIASTKRCGRGFFLDTFGLRENGNG